MKFQGALIKEQGVTFAIVIVKEHVLNDRIESQRLISSFQRMVFHPYPVVLMAQDYRGTPSYFGREDIARFLSNVPMEAISWKEYTINV